MMTSQACHSFTWHSRQRTATMIDLQRDLGRMPEQDKVFLFFFFLIQCWQLKHEVTDPLVLVYWSLSLSHISSEVILIKWICMSIYRWSIKRSPHALPPRQLGAGGWQELIMEEKVHCLAKLISQHNRWIIEGTEQMARLRVLVQKCQTRLQLTDNNYIWV